MCWPPALAFNMFNRCQDNEDIGIILLTLGKLDYSHTPARAHMYTLTHEHIPTDTHTHARMHSPTCIACFQLTLHSQQKYYPEWSESNVVCARGPASFWVFLFILCRRSSVSWIATPQRIVFVLTMWRRLQHCSMVPSYFFTVLANGKTPEEHTPQHAHL